MKFSDGQDSRNLSIRGLKEIIREANDRVEYSSKFMFVEVGAQRHVNIVLKAQIDILTAMMALSSKGSSIDEELFD